MGKKSKKNRVGVVYSTNPDYSYDYDDQGQEETLDTNEQSLHCRIEKKGRRGKVVTIIEGFQGSAEDLGDLAKKLKTGCGVGGSAKDGEIVIQGDQRKKAVQLLKDWGYKAR